MLKIDVSEGVKQDDRRRLARGRRGALGLDWDFGMAIEGDEEDELEDGRFMQKILEQGMMRDGRHIAMLQGDVHGDINMDDVDN
jgi:hypothetical protein